MADPEAFSPLVDEVLEKFDFARVQKAMNALDWSYAGGETPPSLETLKTTARSLLISAAEDRTEEFQSHTGGFTAWRSDGRLCLSFEVASVFAEGRQPGRTPMAKRGSPSR